MYGGSYGEGSPFGFMGLINEYWADRGNDHNAEWAGANPAEYWMMKTGEAMSWRRGKMQEKAQKQAEAYKKAQEKYIQEEQQKLAKNKDEWLNLTNRERSGAEQYYNAFINRYQNLANQYTASAQQDYNSLFGTFAQLAQRQGTNTGQLQAKSRNIIDELKGLATTPGKNLDIFGTPTNYEDGNYHVQPNPDVSLPFLGASLEEQETKIKDIGRKWNESLDYASKAAQTVTDTYGWNPEKTDKKLGELELGMLADPNSLTQMLEQIYTAPAGADAHYLSRWDARTQRVTDHMNSELDRMRMSYEEALREQEEQKAFRIREKANIQGSKEESRVQGKALKAEQQQAKQVSSRRKQTGQAFNPNSRLLSYLTRGY